jgi:MoaA/NifB/PqqE/SkfB family radical SAM enzyme
MISSIRLGRATNSSSAHSIIFHPASSPEVDATLHCDGFHGLEGYGRNNFVLRDKRSKAVFFMWSHFRGTVPSGHERLKFEAVLQKHGIMDIEADLETFNPELQDDGPGTIAPPRGSDITLAEWFDFLLSDEITYVAYDDNSGDPAFMLQKEDIALDIASMSHWRKDGDAIAAYSRRTGTKLRWSTDAYDKSTAPELVDVKITDFCGYGCKFCYQGSTKAGKHAPLARIEEIFDDLSAMRVFEVAIGGGEPAHHPEFAKIIRAATARDISFNFTAFGLDWLKNEDVMAAIRDARGVGIGISVHGKRDITKIARAREALTKQKVWGTDIIGQTVVGATPIATIDAMVDECGQKGVPLLLLGFKTTGRGGDYRRASVSEDPMRKILQKARDMTEKRMSYSPSPAFHLSVDTAFLDTWGDLLDDMQVPKVLRTSPEGRFSMYIDAVEDTVAPSSYCAPGDMKPRGDILAQFAPW